MGKWLTPWVALWVWIGGPVAANAQIADQPPTWWIEREPPPIDGDAPWRLDVAAALRLPTSIGLEASVRSPWHVGVIADVGLLPAAVGDAVVAAVGGSEDEARRGYAQVARDSMGDGLWWIHVAALAWLVDGWELELGYTRVVIRAALSQSTTRALLEVPEDLPSLAVWADRPLALDLHAIHGRVAWRYQDGPFVLRLALGWIHALDYELRHDLHRVAAELRISDDPIAQAVGAEVGARVAEREAEVRAALDAYAFTPELSISAGVSF